MASNVVLEVKNLKKQFGDFTAVNGISLQVSKGEVFGFLGTNGAGKTTSIQMMCGLLKPTEGEVFIQGKSIQFETKETITDVGVCPQSIVIWNKLTCLEQLIFMGQMYNVPTAIAKDRSIKLLNEMGLSEKINNKADTLSGGMQRRLNLILALIHDPAIIILDEPEAGLDPQSRILVREYIKSLAKTKTVILTTHNMDEAERLANRIAIIDHGTLVAIGTKDELLSKIPHSEILHIIIDNQDLDKLNSIKIELEKIASQIAFEKNQLSIKSSQLFDKIPSVLNLLKLNKIKFDSMQIRKPTLEDIFISLTGKDLRE